MSVPLETALAQKCVPELAITPSTPVAVAVRCSVSPAPCRVGPAVWISLLLGKIGVYGGSGNIDAAINLGAIMSGFSTRA
jgi:hypothetical protein